MFSLMDKVPSGIEPMLKDLEEHIINAGLADMVAAAETITTVCALTSYIHNDSALNSYLSFITNMEIFSVFHC